MTTKKQIAVLGGGAASLFAVWDLVHSDPHAYDITVYQMGWRLGGKGASGRNAKLGNRIEEHGLHLMFGFYENVFRVIREAYGEHYSDYPGLWRDFFRTADTEVAMINFLRLGEDEVGAVDRPVSRGGSRTTGRAGLRTGQLRQPHHPKPAALDRRDDPPEGRQHHGDRRRSDRRCGRTARLTIAHRRRALCRRPRVQERRPLRRSGDHAVDGRRARVRPTLRSRRGDV